MSHWISIKAYIFKVWFFFWFVYLNRFRPTIHFVKLLSKTTQQSSYTTEICFGETKFSWRLNTSSIFSSVTDAPTLETLLNHNCKHNFVIFVFNFSLVHLGQVFNGIGGCPVMGCAPFLSNTWFPFRDRVLATGIMLLGGSLGRLLSLRQKLNNANNETMVKQINFICC